MVRLKGSERRKERVRYVGIIASMRENSQCCWEFKRTDVRGRQSVQVDKTGIVLSLADREIGERGMFMCL